MLVFVDTNTCLCLGSEKSFHFLLNSFHFQAPQSLCASPFLQAFKKQFQAFPFADYESPCVHQIFLPLSYSLPVLATLFRHFHLELVLGQVMRPLLEFGGSVAF